MKKYYVLFLLFITSITPFISSAALEKGFHANPAECMTNEGYADWERSASFQSEKEFRLACRRHFCEAQCTSQTLPNGFLDCPNPYKKKWCENVCKGLRWGEKTRHEMAQCGIHPSSEGEFSLPEFSSCRQCYTAAEESLTHLTPLQKEIEALYTLFVKEKQDKFYKKHKKKIKEYESSLSPILRNCHNISCYQQARACALASHLQGYLTIFQKNPTANLKERTNTSSTA